MHVLVVGAAGLLGSNVVECAQRRGFDVVGTYHSTEPSFDVPLHQLDIRERSEFDDLLDRYEIDVVVNCAAMTDVDGCETDPEVAQEINGSAPGELAAACDRRDVSFVHVSTDYIFDGAADSPYSEDDDPNPVQEYGVSKLAGEVSVLENHTEPLIARLSFVYGIDRSTDQLTGFPAWVRGRLQDGEETPLFVDQHVTPSRAGQTAETLLEAVKGDVTGVFNVASRTCVTPFEFGDLIRERLGVPESLIGEGSQAALDRPAERPEYTCLDVSKVEARLGREQPTLKEDLDAIADAFEV